MKLLNHIESELNYDAYFIQTKKQDSNVVYLEDEEQRIWEIRRNDVLPIRNIDSLSSLKSLDSPISLSSGNLRFSTQGTKNRSAYHNFSKLHLGLDQELKKSNEAKETESDIVDYNYCTTFKGEDSAKGGKVIDYQSIHGHEDMYNENLSFNISSQESSPEFNCFELY